MSGEIAVGVPVYSRTSALRQFLESVPSYVETVLVADNGQPEHREERAGLYAEDWDWELVDIHLEPDCGIGKCRAVIAETVSEPYLWIGDCDMEIVRSDDLRVLRDILDANPGVGAVSGWLREGDTVRSGARDLVRDGDRLFKTVREPPAINGDPVPWAPVDMLPQCGLWRSAVFDDYCYDPEIFNSEHVDFFVGHMERSDWTWASTPAVLVEHHRDIDEEYRESKRGQNPVDLDLMAEKWGIEDIQIGQRPDWVSTRERSAFEQAFDVFRRVTPPRLWVPVRRGARRVIA